MLEAQTRLSSADAVAVRFTVKNVAGWESATRLPPPLGYGENTNALINPMTGEINTEDLRSIFSNNSLGMFGRIITMTISWKKIICPDGSGILGN